MKTGQTVKSNTAKQHTVYDELNANSVLVADTGDIESIKQLNPQDATTNPSLILKAATQEEYASLLDEAIVFAKQYAYTSQQYSVAAERLSVLIGCEILKSIPGRVSTEIDARLSFDTQAMIEKAREIIGWYQALGFSSDRILIKIASTWEGIQAANVLEQENIQCNLTLLFNMAQAKACADAKVFLISPFVGRISDWHKAQGESFGSHDDPGVLSVKRIYKLYKKHHVKTIIMAASFRNIGQIQQLNGCDYLTIAPNFLQEMQNTDWPVYTHVTQLKPDETIDYSHASISHQDFLWQLNNDPMAHMKLAEGIRLFAQASEKLEQLLASKF